jgi:hypothetical protein
VPTELYQASGYDVQRYYTEEGEAEGMFYAHLSAIPYDGQVDFQVEGLVGHGAQVFVNDHPLAPYPIGHYGRAIAFDMASGWSSSQTIKIGAATSEAIPPPLVPAANTWETLQTQLIIGIIILVVLLVTASAVHWKKRKSCNGMNRKQ